MGILITIYNSLYGTAKYGTDQYGKLEFVSGSINIFNKFLRKLFYKKTIRNTFYK